MTKYWVFARGGAWRNPKPTGGPYVCEQCRLDACGGNDATLTMQAVTTTELAPADVCADCGARLLEDYAQIRRSHRRWSCGGSGSGVNSIMSQVVFSAVSLPV